MSCVVIFTIPLLTVLETWKARFYKQKNGWISQGMGIQWNTGQGFKDKVFIGERPWAKPKGIMLNGISQT